MKSNYGCLLLIVFGVLWSGSIAQYSDDECLNRILEILETDESLSLQYILYTGKWIEDLGYYHNCVQIPDAHYILYNFTYLESNISVTKHMGICTPIQCQKADAERILTILQEAALGFLLTQNATIEFTFPVEDQAAFLIFTAGTKIAITVVAFLTVLVLAGAVIEYTSIGNVSEIEDLDYEEFSRNDSDDRGMTFEEQMASIQAAPINLSHKKIWWARILITFSFIKNFKALFIPSDNTNPNYYPFLDGIRVISMLWIILAHTYSYAGLTMLVNYEDAYLTYPKEFLFTIVLSAYFAVSVFFFLSAFLGTLSIIKKIEPEAKWPLNPFTIYIQRFIRIFPTYGLTLLIAANLIKYSETGPYWFNYSVEMTNCDKYWWTNILFINNFYPGNNSICYPASWYLSVDMQLFLLVPLLVLVWSKNNRIGLWLTILLLLCNYLISVLTMATSSHNYGISPAFDDDFKWHMFVKPWISADPYLLGILFAFLYQDYLQKNKISFASYHTKIWTLGYRVFTNAEKSRSYRIVSSIIGMLLILFIVFIQYSYYESYGESWNTLLRALYNTFSRSIFIFGLGLLLFPLFVKKSTWLNFFLSSYWFTVLGRLTFCAYLVHPMIIMSFYISTEQPLYVRHLEFIYYAIGHAILAYSLGLALCVLGEAPILNMIGLWRRREEKDKVKA